MTGHQQSLHHVDSVAEAQDWFHQFATRYTARDALYAQLGLAISTSPDLASLLLAAPPAQRNPPLVFAAIHDLLLSGVDHVLRDHFPTCTDPPSPGDRDATHDVRHAGTDPVPALHDFVATHRDAIEALVATRSTQTNSIERTTAILLLVARLGEQVGPLGQVDIGTSGGVGLVADRCRHHYVDANRATHTVVGRTPHEPPLELTTSVSGPAPVPTRMPDIAWRMGVDESPVDLGDPVQVRWLHACVWPGDLPRFHRLGRALDAVAELGPDIVAADAVDDLDRLVGMVPDAVHPTLTTSWVLNYLGPERQHAFLSVLDRIGRRRDLTLVTFESPRRTPGLVVPSGWGDRDETILGWYRWRGGTRTVEHVATADAHGRWVQWWDEPIRDGGPDR